MRFCQAFMLGLWKNLGPDRDVPAGDIGVGGREVGYMYGMYKRLVNQHDGTFTGKALNSAAAAYVLKPPASAPSTSCRTCSNSATTTSRARPWPSAASATWHGARPQGYRTRRKGCDHLRPDGYVYDPAGLDADKINYMLELRASGNDVVAPYAEHYAGSTFFAGRKPWEQKVDIAPPAPQNELNGDDAHALIANGVKWLPKYQIWAVLPKLSTLSSKAAQCTLRARLSTQAAWPPLVSK